MLHTTSTRSLFLTLLFLSIHVFVFSQNNPTIKEPKFGKNSPDALVRMAKEKFPNAHAVVLYDYGRTSYGFSLMDGSIKRDFERHVSILFLDNTEFDFASFEISLRQRNGDKERLGKVKGISYNLVNGKYEKVKLSKKDVITEKIDDNTVEKKFTMPNVKEGTVIEVRYDHSSPFFWNMPSWNFQQTIPTMYSEYVVEIPEFFVFSKSFKGFYAPYIKKVKSSRLENTYQVQEQGWIMTDLPGFESEDYMRSWRNYISRIEFELQMIKYPSGGVKSFSTTWNKVAEELMDRKDFGGQIKKGKAVKGIVSQVSGSNDMEHLLQLFEFVKNKMKWDGDVGLVSRKGVKKTWSEGTGNSADINLLLIATLREAGFKVNPIVLSIRKYGMLPISYPTIDNLNYVLAAVELGDQLIFLDATEDHIPAGTIPDRCLNGEAVILAENNIAQPFIMKPNVKYKSIIQNKLTLTEDLSLEGKLIKTKDGKAAAYFRAEYRDADSEEGLIEEMQNGHEGLTIEEHTLENVMNPYEKVKETYQVSIEDKVEEAGDLLYLNPMLYEGMEENPFKLEERKYPVDFIYPIEEIYMFELEIPEGYGIESLPEKVNLALPEKSGQYAYSAKVIGKKITVLSRLKINKPLFVETEYIGLKEFFNLIIKSHAEQIVLKKI